jgi:predicted ATPase/DNA-binding SARP family transcriptional activator
MTHPTLKIYLLDTFAVEIQGEAMSPLRLQKSKWLLALLALRQGRDVEREWLAETLWPDSDRQKALRNLRQALADDLRPKLGAAASALHATPKTLCLDASDAWVDVVAFDAAIKAEILEGLEKAVELYRGPLLKGCAEEWAFLERVTREETFHSALERLAADALAHGKPGTAIGYLRRLIASDPLRESGYMALMEALAASGDVAGIHQVYRDFKGVLNREIGTEPAHETRALYRRLQQAAQQPSLSPQPVVLSLHRRLPVPLTRLIGRERDIAAAVERFRQGRLVTLVGSGGVGKTHLSIAIAEALSTQFADGVWFVELASLKEPGLVANAVVQALQVKELPGQTILETLVSALSSRSLLMVLDNCEHLIDACTELVEHLLRWCEGLRVLVTSRQALGLSGGEWVYRVPSLEVPPLPPVGSAPEADKNTLSRLLDYDAVRLFLERAVAQGMALRLTTSQTLAIAEICRQLDGIPLAIEMAASRVRTMTLEAIRTGLSDRFRLLRAGSRTSLPRHKTLQALIDWSYDLLSDAEKRLLHRLSVFTGGWTLEAADDVYGAEGEDSSPGSVFELLTSLVDKSLVVYEEWEGKARYRLLETVRQYAAERLVESGESDLVRSRHRDYFLALAETAEPKLRGAEQVEWLQRLEEEHENLRTALAWSLSAMGPEVGLRFCGALSQFWWTWGYFSEGRRWCALALAAADGQQRTLERAKVLSSAGSAAYNQGDYITARTHHEESLAICKESGHQNDIASSLNSLGNVALAQGNYAIAHTLYEECLTSFREIGERHSIAIVLNNLGLLAKALGDYASAHTYHQECLVIFREIEERNCTASALNNLGLLAIVQCDPVFAWHYFEESLAISREIGDRNRIAASLSGLGACAEGQGDYATARRLYEESLTIFREIGAQADIADALNGLGSVAMGQSDYPLARMMFAESLTILQEIGDRRGIAISLESFAVLVSFAANMEQAGILWGAAEALREEIGAPMQPNERALYNHTVAKVRQALGAQALSIAWERGRSMPLSSPA